MVRLISRLLDTSIGPSIRNRLIITVPIIVAVAWSAVTFFNLNQVRKTIEQVVDVDIKMWMEKYSQLIVDELKTGNIARVRSVTYDLIERRIFDNVYVFGLQRKLVLDHVENDGDNNHNLSEFASYFDTAAGSLVNGYYHYPIADRNGAKWGDVFIKPSPGTNNEIIRHRLYKTIVLGFGMLLIEISILIYCLYRIFKPLDDVTVEIKNLSEAYKSGRANLDVMRRIVESSPKGEVKLLGQYFLNFAEKIDGYLKQISRMSATSAIGETAAQIAHDIRKPLTSLKAMLAILPEKRNDINYIENIVKRVDLTILRTNSMLEDILEFSKDASALNCDRHDPKSIIVAAISDSMRDRCISDIKIRYELNHKCYLNVDSNRIVRVFSNIINNAVEAMNGQGVIWLKTKDINNQKAAVSQADGLSEERSIVQIVIGDDGPIIPNDVQKRMFDAFFTHGKPGGTGLGLAICQKIVDMHGGTISFRSEKYSDGKNLTEFIIDLPAVKGELSVNNDELIYHSSELNLFREEASLRMEYGESANINEFMKIHKERKRVSHLLIVDDEPLFRESVRTMLTGTTSVKDHIVVVEADSAEMALKLVEERSFDYVIADIDMGKNKMNGYEMARIILDRYPDTYVLIHSNKRREEMDRNIREIKSPRFMGFLPKPMKQSELLQFLACKTFEARKDAAAEMQVEKKRILVVNDDDALLLTFKMMLKSPAHKVLTAATYDEAVDAFAKEKIDMILSDINLGQDVPNGYEFLRHVRRHNANVPFFMVSGYSASEEEPKARSLGASGYFQLPLEDGVISKLLS